MIFLTSISPRHILEGRQQEATKSWLKHSRVISLNHPSEIEVLKTQGYDKDIEFVPTLRTQKGLFNRHYVCLNALTDYIREHNFEQACVINSDISISEDTTKMDRIKEAMQTSFVYLHRWNFGSDPKQSMEYRDGVDAFFFTPAMADLLPQTMFCLGHCFFDIWLPWFYVIKGYHITSFKEPIIYHQNHQIQYDQGNWHFMGLHTANLTGFSLRPGEISRKAYNMLQTNTIWK